MRTRHRARQLWGLDFGDCHKSLFAHTDNVMAVNFVPRTHLFFTAGKDGVVKVRGRGVAGPGPSPRAWRSTGMAIDLSRSCRCGAIMRRCGVRRLRTTARF